MVTALELAPSPFRHLDASEHSTLPPPQALLQPAGLCSANEALGEAECLEMQERRWHQYSDAGCGRTRRNQMCHRDCLRFAANW
jgi:hypothetical protein